jgi:hypothetical protein
LVKYVLIFHEFLTRGLYIGGKYEPMSFGKKNMKRGREKGENTRQIEER